MATNQYIGARYVPVFADPTEWNSTRTYEPLTIVLHEGNSYTSKQFVPAGIDITNEKFWSETGNYNAQVEAYRKEVLSFDQRITANTHHNEIVSQSYDTLTSAIASDVLVDNTYIETLGFRTAGVGSGIYKVSAKGTPNDFTVFQTNNNMYLTLVTNGSAINIDAIGADPTQTIDSTKAIQYAIDNYSYIYGMGNYLTTDALRVTGYYKHLVMGKIRCKASAFGLIIDGRNITADIKNIASDGGGVRIGENNLTQTFALNIYNISTGGDYGIYFGGAKGVLDGYINGYECTCLKNAVYFDHSKNYVGQVGIYNYRFGMNSGNWVVYLSSGDTNTGFTMDNVSFEGDYNGFYFDTGCESVVVTNLRFTENSFSNNRSLIHINNKAVNGNIRTQYIKCTDVFTSDSVNKGYLTVEGQVTNKSKGIYFDGFTLHGIVPLFTGGCSNGTEFLLVKESTFTIHNYCKKMAYATTVDTNITFADKTYHLSANQTMYISIGQLLDGGAYYSVFVPSPNSQFYTGVITEQLYN